MNTEQLASTMKMIAGGHFHSFDYCKWDMATGTISHTVQTIAAKDVYKVKVLLFCTQASLLWAELSRITH